MLHTYSTHKFFIFFFFNDTATTEIYTLSLHDALPICLARALALLVNDAASQRDALEKYAKKKKDRNDLIDAAHNAFLLDRKSTRLNSSHSQISYAVFCLKKKRNTRRHHSTEKQ